MKWALASTDKVIIISTYFYFQEYSFNEEEQLIFKIDFHTLVECLNMFEASGMSATVDMRMQGPGQPLLLM